MSGVRELTGEEWRVLRLARMAAVEAMPYFANAVFALVPVARPGLKTLAVDRFWRVYIDPDLMAADSEWSIPQLGAVLLHEVGHVLRDHAGRAAALGPVDHLLWNVAGDAEINDDLIAAGLSLPGEPITPQAIGCTPGGIAEVYYGQLAPPPMPSGGDGGDGSEGQDSQEGGDDHGAGAGDEGGDEGFGCGSGAGDVPVPGELPEDADVGSGRGLCEAAADLVRRRVAVATQEAINNGGGGRGIVPAGVQRWATQQLTPPVVPWQKVLRAAVRRPVEFQAGQVYHTWQRQNRRSPSGVALPALRAPKVTVDLIIDTSGSMGDSDLAAALSETRQVLRQASVTARVRCCDAESAQARVVRSIRDVTLTGGGGTDMRVGIAAALADRPRGDVLVVFTDGGTPWPERRLGVPLVVVLIGRHAQDSAPSWATTVRVPPGAGDQRAA